jgi:lysophospholipase L1-like esterase
MKNILCFGDSNTWGYVPGSGERYTYTQRWSGALQLLLGDGYRVLEGGLNGRTTIHDDKNRDFRNGKALLPAFLESHSPLDLIVVMLGTNDLKSYFDVTAEQIADGAKQICETILEHPYGVGQCPQILLVSPALVDVMPEDDAPDFIGAIEKSHQFSQYYSAVAVNLGIHFFDAASVVQPCPIDGVHWSQSQHEIFAHAIKAVLVNILGG